MLDNITSSRGDGDAKIFIMYDIACSLHKHLQVATSQCICSHYVYCCQVLALPRCTELNLNHKQILRLCHVMSESFLFLFLFFVFVFVCCFFVFFGLVFCVCV